MRTIFRAFGAVLALAFLMLACTSGTYCRQSSTQQAKNEIQSGITPNIDIPPIEIDPPVIEKITEGNNPPETEFTFLLHSEQNAPLPKGGSDTFTHIGSGEVKIGTFSFLKPGVYVYTISELNTGAEGWEYDDTVYILTFTVTQDNGKLHPSYTLTSAGDHYDRAVFVNRYSPASPPDTPDSPNIPESPDTPDYPETSDTPDSPKNPAAPTTPNAPSESLIYKVENPKTGDNRNVLCWDKAMVVSLTCIFVILKIRKKTVSGIRKNT